MGNVRQMELVGGHVALDFVNTLGGLPERPDDEYLSGYSDVLAWLERVRLLTPERGHETDHAAMADPRAAAAVFEQVRVLRTSLDRILRCHLTDVAADARDLEVVRSAYAEATASAVLLEEAGSHRLSWDKSHKAAIGWPMWVLADSAMDLLTRAPLHLLGRCRNCRWIFLDYSKNHSRRWCSMNSCGAITKMRRYRAAHRPVQSRGRST